MPSTPDLVNDLDYFETCSSEDGGSGGNGNVTRYYRMGHESLRRKRYLPPTPMDIALMHQRVSRNCSFPDNSEEFRSRGYTMPSYIGSARPSAAVLERIRQRSMSDCSKRSPNHTTNQHIETPSRLVSDSPSPSSSDLISKTSSGESSPRIFKHCRILIAGYDNVGKETILKKLIKLNRPTDVPNNGNQTGGTTSESIKIKLGAEYYELFFETINSFRNIHEIEKQARGMDALLLIYSIVERKSFENAAQLLVLTKLNLVDFKNKNPVILVAGNKVDLERLREVTTEEAKKLCQRFEVKHVEISALLDFNFDLLMKQLSKQIWLNKINEYTPGDSTRSLRSLVSRSNNDLVSSLGRKLSGKVFNRLWRGSKYWSRSCDQLNNL
ncbi:GTP-binding protein GEM-like [Brevipalpus obovatus]|uniref:GTP-binding protein GEM-like n=1 Tax=Brevipalpus obovatus TaxID=246614 RepID=UPI003D9E891C